MFFYTIPVDNLAPSWIVGKVHIVHPVGCYAHTGYFIVDGGQSLALIVHSD